MERRGIMKAAVLLACICTVLAGRYDHTMEEIVEGMTDLFSISMQEAQQCIQKTQVQAAEMDLLIRWFNEKVNGAVDMTSLNRASCALTCCAQLQGTMVGSKMNLSKIDELVTVSDMPPDMKVIFYDATRFCNQLVKDKTNECEAGREFMMCYINETRRRSRARE